MLIYLPVAEETAQRNPAQASTQWSIKAKLCRTLVRFLLIFFGGGFVLHKLDKLWLDRSHTGQICINVSVNHEQWMDAVSVTLQKRHQITRRCYLRCCRTVTNYGKVTGSYSMMIFFFVFAPFVLHISLCIQPACIIHIHLVFVNLTSKIGLKVWD